MFGSYLISPPMKYKSIYEIDEPHDLKFGRFYGYFKLFRDAYSPDKAEIYQKQYMAVIDIIDYLMSPAISDIERHMGSPPYGYSKVLRLWQIFYYCVTTYNFAETQNTCTNIEFK